MALRARLVSMAAVATVVVLAIASLVTGTAGASGGPTQFPSKYVTLTGHGYGPGFGLGQWGAFGLATVDHFTYHEILARYYSDTAHPVTDATLSAKADAKIVRVVIEEQDNHAITLTSPSAFTYVDSQGKTLVTVPAGTAARAIETRLHGGSGPRTGVWLIQTGASCTPKSWKTVAKASDPTAVPASLLATAPDKDLLTLCRADGQDVTYRGSLEAFDYYGSATNEAHLERTLNLVSIEEYVADVTPGESPAGWGAYGVAKDEPQGEPWGFQELEAQAIASRTYALYEIANGGWFGYADICDDVCEYYSEGIRYENPLSTLAVHDTAGQYLVQNKEPAPTEYSSSDGGHTDAMTYWNGKSIFDPAKDPGDSVCIGGQQSLGCNPWHTWGASVSVASVEGQFPTVGALVSVTVISTDKSGRVSSIEIVGKKATVSVSGAAFQSDFGLMSSLFVVTDGPGATQKAGPQAAGPQAAGPHAAGPQAAGPQAFVARSLPGGSPGFRPPVSPLSTRMLAGAQH
ncbi:MAG: SpoIID/LytB domain-containing protein [Acidimicrobiales bacterium]